MPISPQRLVILDRDGVINQDSRAYIKTLDEWIPYPQAIDAIARLSQAGWTIAVATNQSGIGRGYYSEAVLAQMHQRMLNLVGDAGGKIAHIAYCPHGPDDQCDCRKPKTGLLIQIRQALGMATLECAWMVGDSLRDLQAGMAMGCHPVLVRTGKGRGTESESANELVQATVFDDLSRFVDWIEDSGL